MNYEREEESRQLCRRTVVILDIDSCCLLLFQNRRRFLFTFSFKFVETFYESKDSTQELQEHTKALLSSHSKDDSGKRY